MMMTTCKDYDNDNNNDDNRQHTLNLSYSTKMTTLLLFDLYCPVEIEAVKAQPLGLFYGITAN